MEIVGRQIGDGQRTLVIAEIGNNHDGSIGQAKALIEAAAEAGADAAKFQTHIAEAEMLPSTPTPPHFDEPRFAFTERMQLTEEEHLTLREFAEERGLIFFSSPFSVEAVELLERIDNPLYKVASGEVTNPPLLEAIAATGKPVLISSGMSGLGELDAAIAVFKESGSDVCLMQCTSAYPCPPEQVNLRAMEALADRFGVPVGLSDHTAGIATSIAAAALGAACVEKHFTLDRRLYGPDHKASLTPEDLKALVDGIKEIHEAMGTGEKVRDPALDPVRATFEKSIVTRETVPAGTTLDATMLTTKRPGNGVPAARISEMIGRKVNRDLEANVLLEESDLS